ncbi:PDDEXK nuclease domain-containing protein [Brasilonema sp. UFV-L1]|uniref:PDDEXK nuclease domain-containing protein n=1 Tax=Brasilonema sp. UFV-L1 TaxID=2234130 RepID=UPI00145E55D7|nr:PDDEXK nuclease domain-containing protein [Brasilonema sp. UFV-L1]NMG11182.1 DUF1016 domain-containing protein [Brasilonema sp. UFV-L1]
MNSGLPSSYPQFLSDLKRRIQEARYLSLKAINKESIALYWDTGKMLSQKVEKEKWGSNVVDRVSQDIKLEFPGIKGYSKDNLWRMKKFYETYKESKLAPVAQEIPWSQNVIIMEKAKEEVEKEFYINLCLEKGLSKRAIEEKILMKEFANHQRLQTNFSHRLVNQMSVEEINKLRWQFKDDYNLSLIGIREEVIEKQLEDGLVRNIVKLLRELGPDFCFCGRQFPLEVDGEDYPVDLLFYHRKYRGFILFELKAKAFSMKDMGQIQGYLEILDTDYKYKEENPAIGILMCRDKNRSLVEYALRSTNKPVSVVTYNFQSLPEKIAKFLPSEEQLLDSLDLEE